MKISWPISINSYFFQYKYQLNLDGTVAAFRFPYLLVGGSLVFKQKSKYYEHFYSDLTENIHYIPVKQDLSDIIEKVNWALKHDNAAKEIARKGQDFAVNNLLPKNIFCYHVQLLYEFSKRIVSDVKVLPGMVFVPQPKETITGCKCKSPFREEL